MTEQISDEGVIYPHLPNADAIGLRLALDVVQCLDRWVTRTTPKFPLRPLSPRRVKRVHWDWKRAEPDWERTWAQRNMA